VNEWVLAPLGVLVACALWVWLANRRPRVGGLVWPEGFALGGEIARPDIDYDGTVVLAGGVSFGTIRCRSLVIARGADVTADSVDAVRVKIEGALDVTASLVARKRLDVRGSLNADEVIAPRIRLQKRARATVIVAPGNPKIDRHPDAVVKGFFATRGEFPSRRHPADDEGRTLHLLDAG
jgi:hypothetical protein